MAGGVGETLTGHEHDLARRHLLEVPLELLRGPIVEKEAGSAEEGSARAKCVATVPLARRAHAGKARLGAGSPAVLPGCG